VSAGDAERPIVLLRNQLLELRQQPCTRATRQRQYALTSRALSAYLKGDELVVLRPTTWELFILPEEMQAAA
jgi:hypothetical protein